jgi:hypothetical protein
MHTTHHKTASFTLADGSNPVPDRGLAHPAFSDAEFLKALFTVAFTTLLRAEARALSYVNNSIPDVIGIHNIFEDARTAVVMAYLPMKTGTRIVDCDPVTCTDGGLEGKPRC